MSQRDWNAHYVQGFLPWDSDYPDEHLVEFVRSERLAPCRVLDVGCGTGTHSLWLAEQGFEVIGVDLSELAVQRANEKAAGRSGRCRFEVLDILAHAPPGVLSSSCSIAAASTCSTNMTSGPASPLVSPSV